ncbi:MAG: helix-hairpin-helix domain-containing protein, partial [Planctomycetota bacterium]
ENLRLVLEEVPGIGPAKRKILLDAYRGDLGRLRDAKVEEVADLDGMTLQLAAQVQEHLRRILP